MSTRPTRLGVSKTALSAPYCRPLFALAVLAALASTACIGTRSVIGEAETAVPRNATVQFDNFSTTLVDVYLVGTQMQWRLGRVPPGMHVALRVPERAMDSTLGFFRLTVIPGSQLTSEADRHPRAVFAIALPVSVLLKESWTFRQVGSAAMQLQGERFK